MERLSADDQVMLWPDAVWPQEIGAIILLDGRAILDPDGHLRIDAVSARIASRLYRIPRFRQLLVTPGRGQGGPLWADAPAFDIRQHVRVMALTGPDEDDLLRAVERVRRRRLDRSRPLWQMTFFPGLSDHRVGLYVSLHHAIADGMASIATVAALLDTEPDPPEEPAPPPWRPQPMPTVRELYADSLHRSTRRLGRLLWTAAHPVATTRTIRSVLPALREFTGARPAPPTSLHCAVGPDRSIALIRGSLDTVKRIARCHRATVNDVLLSAIAGGVRALMLSRGESVDDRVVPIDVPVTLRRREDRAQARGNQIGQILVPLPIGLAQPDQRLSLIAADTTIRKATHHPSMGVALRSRFARRILLKLLDRQPVNLTSANLPGPPEPVYLAGARLLEVFPVLSLMGTVTIGVGAVSYAGQFNVAVVADRTANPDLEVFAAHVRQDLTALTADRWASAVSR